MNKKIYISLPYKYPKNRVDALFSKVLDTCSAYPLVSEDGQESFRCEDVDNCDAIIITSNIDLGKECDINRLNPFVCDDLIRAKKRGVRLFTSIFTPDGLCIYPIVIIKDKVLVLDDQPLSFSEYCNQKETKGETGTLSLIETKEIVSNRIKITTQDKVVDNEILLLCRI